MNNKPRPSPPPALLLDYANGTLPAWMRWLAALWLRLDPSARRRAESLRALRTAIQSQPVVQPPPGIGPRARAAAKAVRAGRPAPFWPAWTAGMAILALSLAICWKTLPPGVILEWSAPGQPAGFRIYRAPASQPSPTFQLVGEIPVEQPAGRYSYLDVFLLPGQEYAYRVEALDANGQPAARETIVSGTLGALPGQAAILMLAGIFLYGLSLAVHRPRLTLA